MKNHKNYQALIADIGNSYQIAKGNIVTAINTAMLQAYWEIGQFIVEYEQEGNIKATYGDELLVQLSKDLSLQYGKGFSRSNLTYMRMLYLKYPIRVTLSHKLSWSHYYELLKVEDEYAMLNDSSKLIVSKYQLYLPNVEQLKRKVQEIIER